MLPKMATVVDADYVANPGVGDRVLLVAALLHGVIGKVT
jgi:hypothetical protein